MTEDAARRVLSLLMYQELSREQVETVPRALGQALDGAKPLSHVGQVLNLGRGMQLQPIGVMIAVGFAITALRVYYTRSPIATRTGRGAR